jgi:hypothetical protein
MTPHYPNTIGLSVKQSLQVIADPKDLHRSTLIAATKSSAHLAE